MMAKARDLFDGRRALIRESSLTLPSAKRKVMVYVLFEKELVEKNED